jgi:hypothetical protein
MVETSVRQLASLDDAIPSRVAGRVIQVDMLHISGTSGEWWVLAANVFG